MNHHPSSLRVVVLALFLTACTGVGETDETTTLTTTPASPTTTEATTTTEMETTSTAGSASTEPVARGHMAMTSIDEEWGVMMFGGVTSPPPEFEVLGDAWTLADRSDGWLPVDSLAPVGGDTIAYDSESGQVILYTAWEGPSEIWAMAPTTGEWVQMSTDSVPQGIWAPHLVYDEESDVVIMIGPPDPSPESGIATWAYDFDVDSWTEMHSASTMPKRWFPAMAYDAAADRVIVFGGFSANDAPLADTWAYDFNSDTWTELMPDVSPPPRGYSAMAYDPISDRTILFGGSTHTDPLNDTWAYDSQAITWTELNTDLVPPARDRHGTAFNPVDGTIVLFGGATILGSGPEWEALPVETWVFDPVAEAWSPIS